MRQRAKLRRSAGRNEAAVVIAVTAVIVIVIAMAAPASAADPYQIDAESCRKAIAYSDQAQGASVLVMVGDQVVCEAYGEGHGPETAFHLASATKSFWGVAAAAMVADGLLELDELAANTLTEWREDPRRSRITVRHLLSLTSGLAEDVAAIQGMGSESVPDKYLHAIGLEAETEPGEAFRYGPSHFYAFGELMRRKLAPRKQDPLAYLEARILEPIGLRYERWVRDGAGNPHLPNGAYLTARQWAKLGRLVLQNGRWEGRKIVPAALLAECFEPAPANPGYGLTWWLNRPGGKSSERAERRRAADAPAGSGGFIYPDAYPDLSGALGAGPNRLYVIPSLDLVAIRQSPWEARPAGIPYEEWVRSNSSRGAFSDAVFLRLLLTGRAEPAS